MKKSFLLLLFVIITISTLVLTLRKYVTIEKFQNEYKFLNDNCLYPDKIIRTSGDMVKNCDPSKPTPSCEYNFEDNAPCIKDNFIDKRCKLIKIWYATKETDSSHYTFSENNTHIIQMGRDKHLTCQSFGNEDSDLVEYLNRLRISDIKDNTTTFETKEQISNYSGDNRDPKIVIGYAYGSSDEETQTKGFDDMKVCINFEDKFYVTEGYPSKRVFNKKLLKDSYDEKNNFRPELSPTKEVKTNVKNYKRYIRKSSNNLFTIEYGKDSSTTAGVFVDLSSKPKCNRIIDKPHLWMKVDKNYHRVKFKDSLVNGQGDIIEFCTKIQDLENPSNSIITTNNMDLKTTRELEELMYEPSEDDPDVYVLTYNLSDPNKWFVFDNGDVVSEHNVSQCTENQFESSPPQKNTDNVNISDRNCVTCKTSQFIDSEKKCEDLRSIMNGISKDTHYVDNYNEYDSKLKHFRTEPIFKQLTNCDTTQYTSNKNELEQSKIKLDGNILNDFYTIDRTCSGVTYCNNETQYVKNSEKYKSLNDNTLSTDIECATLQKCSPTQYRNKMMKKITIGDALLNAEDYSCADLKICTDTQYVSNINEMNESKKNPRNKGMYTSNVKCAPISNCQKGEFYQKEAPKKDNNLNMFVSDRVCTEVNKCDTPLQVEIPLDKSLITRNLNLDSMKFGSTSTTNICTFNNQYFIKKNKDLDYCNCSRIVLKYTISASSTTDILKHSPKFILRKRNKEALMIMKLNISSSSETTYDTSTDIGIFNAFNKYPNDEYDLYFDTGSYYDISLSLSEFKFYCSRQQEIDIPTDGIVDNICRYEQKNIKSCNAPTQYYDLDTNGKYVCKDYDTDNCKISDQKKSCAIDRQRYINENIDPSYKRLYNDTLSSDTASGCQTKCDDRKGCGAFLINSLSNVCEYYGFETVKIEIANINRDNFNIKYTIDDNSASQNLITKDITTFTNPVHITQLTIEPKQQPHKVNALPDNAHIKFYYYDNTYKTYTNKPNSNHNNEVDINYYIRTDTLLEIQDIYYISP